MSDYEDLLLELYISKLKESNRKLKMIKYRLEEIKKGYEDDKNLCELIDFVLEVYDDQY